MIWKICNFPYWISQSPPLYSGRAEGLKKSQSKSAPAQTHDRTGPSGTKASSAGTSGAPVRQFFPLGPDFSLHERPQPQPVRAVQTSEPHGQRYTSEEIEVLRWALKNSWITLPSQGKVLNNAKLASRSFWKCLSALKLQLLYEQPQGSAVKHRWKCDCHFYGVIEPKKETAFELETWHIFVFSSFVLFSAKASLFPSQNNWKKENKLLWCPLVVVHWLLYPFRNIQYISVHQKKRREIVSCTYHELSYLLKEKLSHSFEVILSFKLPGVHLQLTAWPMCPSWVWTWGNDLPFLSLFREFVSCFSSHSFNELFSLLKNTFSIISLIPFY